MKGVVTLDHEQPRALITHAAQPAAAVDQRTQRVAEVLLVRAAREPVEDHEHGRGVVEGLDVGELLVGEVVRARGQAAVPLQRRLRPVDDEVDGELAGVGGVVGLLRCGACSGSRRPRF